MGKLVILGLVLVLVIGTLLGACTTPSPTASPSPSPTPTASPSPSPKPTASPSPTTPAGPTAEEFYKKNPVTFIIPVTAGGAGDFAGRTYAQYLATVMGANIQCVNKPEAGGIAGVNEVYASKPDGLTIGIGPLGTRITGAMVFKDPGMKFDGNKFNYIGQFADEPYAFAAAIGVKANNINEMKALKGLKLAGRGKTGGPTLGLALVSYFFNLDASVITGYGGGTETGPACGKGEADGEVWSFGTIKDHADKGWVKTPFLAIGYSRSGVYPNTPTIPESMKLTPEQDKILQVFNLAFSGAQTLFAPPGIPADRVKYLRDTFAKVTAVKAFQDAIATRWGVFDKPLTGEEVAALVAKLAAMPQSDIDKLNEVTKPYIK